jgi:hypothetical protein
MKHQIRQTKSGPIELSRHGGVDAKKWRRQVANAASRPPKSLMYLLKMTTAPRTRGEKASRIADSDGVYLELTNLRRHCKLVYRVYCLQKLKLPQA